MDSVPPAPTPARVAAAATAAGCARMANLRAALSATLREALASNDFDVFQACFPGFEEDTCVALHDLYRQVLHSARAHAEAEFDEICQEAHLVDRLAAAEAAAARAGPTPDDAARGARVAAKSAELARLRSAAAAAEDEVAGLEGALAGRRAEVGRAAARYAALAAELAPLADAAAAAVAAVQ